MWYFNMSRIASATDNEMLKKFCRQRDSNPCTSIPGHGTLLTGDLW